MKPVQNCANHETCAKLHRFHILNISRGFTPLRANIDRATLQVSTRGSYHSNIMQCARIQKDMEHIR